MVRLGVIVRGDRRGLRYQTRELAAALQPDVTVGVDISPLDPNGQWPQDFDAGTIVTEWAGHGAPISDEATDALLSCDVIYSAETFYDPRLVEAANRRRIATVRHINCELYTPEGESHPIFPSAWRLPHVPEGPTVPVPVPDGRIASQIAGPGLVLHVGGHRAWQDRNGTRLVHGALRWSKSEWRITSQSGGQPKTVETVGDIEDRWGLYSGCAVLVMPRKYGGLCLPAQEAAARGLALVMSDMVPQSEWPIVAVPVHRWFNTRRHHVQVDRVGMVNPRALAETVDGLVGGALLEAQERALAWARSLAWSKWAPEYRKLFLRAAEEMR